MALLLTACLAVGTLAGCSSGSSSGGNESAAVKENSEKKTFVFGDTTFNPENEEPDVNPHNTYAGWACIRYGVGETLFHYSDSMEIEPWLAKSFENVDDLTWKITLQDGVKFTSGMGSCLGLEQAESRTAAATAAAILSFVLMSYSLGKEFNLISMTPTNGLVIGAWRKASSQLLRAAAASPLAR